MSEFVCNYAIARFRPYRETGEFVNVGVVLLCPQLGFLGHAFERRKHKRITDFFPELDIDVFKAGLAGLLKELSRMTGHGPDNQQFVLEDEAQIRLAAFRELVRVRETLFHFGEVGTVLAEEPKAKLAQLFNYYIERQFARDREYQEIIMRRRLGDFLQKINLARFYRQDQRVGDDNYHVILPFVHFEGDKPRKVIKPLHLEKPTTTDIYRHGDAWISHVRRLQRINRLPKDFLFAVRYPGGKSKGQAAAREICNDLEKLGALTVPFADTEAIRRFAQV